ncbi:MAG TPA: S1 RNA-binding domain-containing protein [Anaerolineae bacterium]|nr:S1 RNA-binding domain-containing protein [Anaerolineae bacterium]
MFVAEELTGSNERSLELPGTIEQSTAASQPKEVEAAGELSVEESEFEGDGSEALVESTVPEEPSSEPGDVEELPTPSTSEVGTEAAESAEQPSEPSEVEEAPTVSPSEVAVDENTSMEAYLESEYTLTRPQRGDLLYGTIVQKKPEGLMVDIGAKREGFVPARDLERLPQELVQELQVGDEIPVIVQRSWTNNEELILSLSQARREQDWLRATEMLESGEIGEYEVTDKNRGGVTVWFGRLRGFVPASHLVGFHRDMSPDAHRQALARLIGKTLRLKVIEVDRRRRRLVLSQRLAEREYRERRKAELLQTLKVGDVLTGRVTALRNFGAFVDIGGADGLVHISEISWQKINHPRDVLLVGQTVEVQVIRVDPAKQRIGLSIKRLLPNPWDSVRDLYQPGQLVEGVITNVLSFGAFAQLESGVEGLIHVSELTSDYVEHPRQVVRPGEQYTLRILSVDPEHQRIALSLKRAPQWIEVPPEPVTTETLEAETPEAEPAAVEAVESAPEPEHLTHEQAEQPAQESSTEER